MEPDSFLTIKGESEGLFKDKGSKFIAKAYPVENEGQVKEILAGLKKEYHDARHHCYAYRINPEDEQFRSNDDGEPSGTAGKPILNQLLSKELMNVMVVVIRYFGGTKLGVSGLINAYKNATIEALNNSSIVKQFIYRQIEIRFDYLLMNSVMRLIKEEDADIVEQDRTGRPFMITVQEPQAPCPPHMSFMDVRPSFLRKTSLRGWFGLTCRLYSFPLTVILTSCFCGVPLCSSGAVVPVVSFVSVN